ncbi:ester cyclase [Taibaiella chishuiensis]|uniref:SnoaL-like polyketide cyclase n=1 Tax=Taibaiella chishuiensis TaxID=1434707 RepID=A0A2P8DCW0_9BACT|nr:ester cyclase [Taibaiella chishuiensis]PSK95035.1 SnoaL-like polyketide cyclase [Taibaiella chishuiensis]
MRYLLSVLMLTTGILLTTATIGQAQSKPGTREVTALRQQLKTLTAADARVKQHLDIFDTLDYTVFSNQQWERFHESHAKNIKVYWPDGHMTEGLAVHIEDMKKLFVHAPDTRIKIHPIKFGSGDFTAVTGVFEGTFTQPMPIGEGKFIQPTGKAFKMPMATIGIWKDGVMIEEHLFWDNQTYANQVGLGQQ